MITFHILENGKSWHDLSIGEENAYLNGNLPFLCGLTEDERESGIGGTHAIIGVTNVINPSSVCSTCILMAFSKGMKLTNV